MEMTEAARRWSGLFTKYESGELTRKGFCEAHGLKLSTFDYWRRRLRTMNDGATTVKVAMVQSERPAIRILVGDVVVIELDGGADAAQIRRVIEAVSRL